MNLNTVRTKLISIAVLAALSLVVIGNLAVSGINTALGTAEGMYSVGMTNCNNTNKVIAHLNSTRDQLLLALQHNPKGEYADMHDHPVAQHLDKISYAFQEMFALIDNEILPAPASPEDKEVTRELRDKIEDLNKIEFKQAIELINNGDYVKANVYLLKNINPKYEEIKESAHKLVESTFKSGEDIYHETEDETQTFILELIVAIIATGVVICFVVFFISRRINIALSKIQAVAEDIVSGDLSKQVKLDGKDELSTLAYNVDLIVESFQEVISGMNESASQLSATAEESSAISAQTQHNVIEQQQQTQMVATAINEFAATVQEVANNASSAAGASEEAEAATLTGKEVVTDTISLITELSSEISATTRLIQQLSDQSDEIGSIVDVIEGISEQTNLLALNAAIEAARAGEAGRGFAVVADEVRSLASRTQQSTVEIKAMISSLQESSKESLVRMESGAKQTESTVETAEKAGVALDEISTNVSQIAALNTQIATAAEEQSVVTEEISENISSINDISAQTANGAEQSSEASSQLADLTEAMRGQVSKFTL